MKNINHKSLKLVNRWIAGILAIFGFSGCNNNDEPAMYGTPLAVYHLSGKVQNSSKEGLPNIKLETQILSGVGFDSLPDTVITNSEGDFQTSFEWFPTQKIRIIATDIDGDKNGIYTKDSIDIVLSKNDYKGADGTWFAGEINKKELNIELKEEIKNE